MIDYKNTVQSELLTNNGRIDMVLETEQKIFIFEFKIDQSAEKAVEQIRSKGYPEKFEQSPKKIILIGIDFSSEERNIREYRIENYEKN